MLPRDMLFATKEFLIVFWVINFLTLALARVAGYQVLSYARSRGKNLRNLVIVAEGAEAIALAHRIEKETTLGYRVVRVINAEEV
jgi:FlaA1/EpsC-like NDP-sugar epimerase